MASIPNFEIEQKINLLGRNKKALIPGERKLILNSRSEFDIWRISEV
jgi:hypothetical protein